MNSKNALGTICIFKIFGFIKRDKDQGMNKYKQDENSKVFKNSRTHYQAFSI